MTACVRWQYANATGTSSATAARTGRTPALDIEVKSRSLAAGPYPSPGTVRQRLRRQDGSRSCPGLRLDVDVEACIGRMNVARVEFIEGRGQPFQSTIVSDEVEME
jgi:hypothetical protein